MLYKDATQPTDERVKDLLARMSLAEKLAQLRSLDAQEVAPDGMFDAEAAALQLADGVGHLVRSKAEAGLEQIAVYSNDIQRFLTEETRLGIPVLVFERDAIPAGANGVARLPAPIALAASFSTSLAREFGLLQRSRMRAIGSHMRLSPVLDVAHGHSGRPVVDCYGDNPYLVARIGVAAVRGLQGELLRDGVAACAGYFVGGGGRQQAWRLQVGPRQLREQFAEPFAAAIRDADLAAVMLGTHSLDGLVPSVSRLLLQDVLRDELGFEGVVVSDASLMQQLIDTHRLASDERQAAARALRAGVDAQLPDSRYFEEPLALSVRDERIELGQINQAVRRILRLKFRLGLFDQVLVDETATGQHFSPAREQDYARKLAGQSMVLLHNDGVLPMQRNIAQVNPGTSTVTSTMTSAVLVVDCIGDAAANVNDSATQPTAASLVAKALRARLGDHVSYAAPRWMLDEHTGAKVMSDQLLETAGAADIAVICLGAGEPSNAATRQGIGEAHHSILENLPDDQMKLVRGLVDTGTRVISVVYGGLFAEIGLLAEHSSALLLAWQPGAHGGEALVDLLFGDVNPAGRLPVELPAASQASAFCFGYGMSYSNVEYANLQCPESVDTHGVLRLAFDVTNGCAIAADEVVQVYAVGRVAKVRQRDLQLIAFNRIHLEGGATRTCEFRIDPSQLAYFNEAMQLSVGATQVQLRIGGSSADVALQAVIRITGPRRKLLQRQIVAAQVTGPA